MNRFLSRSAIEHIAHANVAVDQNRGGATLVRHIGWGVRSRSHIGGGIAIPDGRERIGAAIDQVQHIGVTTLNFDGRRRGAHGIYKRFGEENFVGAAVAGEVKNF